MVVLGHNELAAIRSFLNSRAQPSVIILMPYFAIVYATCGPNHFGSRFNGGDNVSICGFADFFKYGMHVLVTKKVPRRLMSCIRSKRLGSVCSVDVSEMAE